MIDLKTVLGTINFTDYVHVTASKVSNPSVPVREVWIDVPVTSYAFVFTGLDPVNYILNFYDAPTNSSLGTLQLSLIVNGLNPEFAYERKFYTVGGAGDADPADSDTSITDSYLVGKNVTGCFKEGFRYLVPDVEYTFNDTTGVVAVINGTSFSTDEVFAVEIKYSTGATSSSGGGGLYNSTITVTESTRKLLPDEVQTRVRLKGTGSTQEVILPPLAAIAADTGFYFDNTVGGVAQQPKILTDGSDLIYYNGFNGSVTDFAEFWVGKGEHLLLRKLDDTYWEVIMDYAGQNVGEQVTLGYKIHPNVITESGQILDGDEWGRIYWWVTTQLASSNKYSADLSGSFTHTANKRGQFAFDTTNKKIAMPNTVGLVNKGLANFETYGGDTANRTVDAPGGFQEEMVLEHGHSISTTNGAASANSTADPVRGTTTGDVNARGIAGSGKTIGLTGGVENRVKNNGVIYGRRV